MVFPLLIDRLKDNNKQVQQQSMNALEEIFYSLNIEEIIEEMKILMNKEKKSMNPMIKLNIVKYSQKIMEKMLKSEGKQRIIQINALNGMMTMMKGWIDDGNSEIRESMAKSVGMYIGMGQAVWTKEKYEKVYKTMKEGVNNNRWEKINQ